VLGSLEIPFGCLDVILLDPFTFSVHQTEINLSLHVTLISRPAVTVCGFCKILFNAFTSLIHDAKIMESCLIILFGRL